MQIQNDGTGSNNKNAAVQYKKKKNRYEETKTKN